MLAFCALFIKGKGTSVVQIRFTQTKETLIREKNNPPCLTFTWRWGISCKCVPSGWNGGENGENGENQEEKIHQVFFILLLLNSLNVYICHEEWMSRLDYFLERKPPLNAYSHFGTNFFCPGISWSPRGVFLCSVLLDPFDKKCEGMVLILSLCNVCAMPLRHIWLPVRNSVINL